MLLGLSSIAAAGFIVEYALSAQTRLLGLALGLALLFLAAALILTGKRLVASEELEDDYPPEESYYYLAHALGSIVRWSLEPETWRAMFEELEAAKANRRADPARLFPADPALFPG